ncbi:hypothetical protein [Terribacillus saccharophilus]|uniref:hypothetical protein n=1 Tax=Terribacillus saccharophilus TaxID=361277 RepID=UPI003982CAD2
MLATIYNLLLGKSIGIPAIQTDLYPKSVGQVKDETAGDSCRRMLIYCSLRIAA